VHASLKNQAKAAWNETESLFNDAAEKTLNAANQTVNANVVKRLALDAWCFAHLRTGMSRE
jgi:hypothetical protein